jgi:hypothetical protein
VVVVRVGYEYGIGLRKLRIFGIFGYGVDVYVVLLKLIAISDAERGVFEEREFNLLVAAVCYHVGGVVRCAALAAEKRK